MSLVDELEKLKIPHLVVDGDCWYSCPLAVEPYWANGSASCDDAAVARGECTCLAQSHNAAVDAIVAAASLELSEAAVALGRVEAMSRDYKAEAKSMLRSSLQAVNETARAAYDASEHRGYRVVRVDGPQTFGDLAPPTSDAVVLRWFHQRLVDVHGENPHYDYMQRLERMIVAADEEEMSRRVPCYKCGAPHPAWTHAHLDGAGAWGDSDWAAINGGEVPEA